MVQEKSKRLPLGGNLKKFENKQHQIQKELENAQTEINALKKLKYIDLYTKNVLSKEELIKACELTDVNINELQLKKSQLIEIKNDCDNEYYAIQISEKLKDVISLEELTPQVFHSLVKKKLLVLTKEKFIFNTPS